MKISIIESPRCGGTAYAKLLSEKYNIPFLNEPLKVGYTSNEFLHPSLNVSLGGGLKNHTSYSAHHITSQFVSFYKKTLPDDTIILIERKNKWEQFLSYCIMRELSSVLGIHNYNFTENIEITVKDISMEFMCYEWNIYSYFKDSIQNYTLIYYEDIVFPHNFAFRKNIGYDRIKISNLKYVEKFFNDFWKI